MSWDKYYEKNKGRPLRALYSQAILFLRPSANRAMDLGCGDGTEVLDLLQRGFEVHAVDQEPKSIELISKNAATKSEKFHSHVSSLENWNIWPKVDFLFAYHSFPFCKPHGFDDVVAKSLSSVVTDGIFAASFFGPQDEWVKEKKVVGISAEDVRIKLSAFEILHFDEIRKIGPTALQGDKMWNVIEVSARRHDKLSNI